MGSQAGKATHILLLAMLLLITGIRCLADVPQPVIAVDEAHWNSLALTSSIWRMTTLRDELVAGGYAVREIDDAITANNLSNCSVLIITTPGLPINAGEIAAMQAFVNNGGGLLFCANNGPSSVWSSICQGVANAFGYILDNNTATDNIHNASGCNRWVTFGSSCLGAHPVTNGLSAIQSFSTTTLAPSANSTIIASTDADATPSLRPAIEAGSYGAGRIIISGSPLYFADTVLNRDIGGGNKADMTGLSAADNRHFAYNAVTWLAGAAGRPIVTITQAESVVAAGDTLEIDGTVCDAALVSYVLEYMPVSGAGEWIRIGTVHTDSVVRGQLGCWNLTGIAPGDYTLRVRAVNSAGASFSASELVHVAYTPGKIADLRGVPAGAYVELYDKEVVAGSDDLVGRVYLEEGDRSSGICVLTSASVNRGSLATVIGVVGMVDGAPAIIASSVTTHLQPAGDGIRAVGLKNSSAGIPDSGLSASGMLVRVWGSITGLDSDGFTITDGSSTGLKVLTNYALSPVTSPAAGMVAVTGISTTVNGCPALIARQAADIQEIK